MKAIILAAGVARRLAPLTDRTHKCLLEIGGRPLLARMLAALEGVGVKETVLVVGHFADQVRAAAGDKLGAMRLRYVENGDYTRGSALSLYAARAHLRLRELMGFAVALQHCAQLLRRFDGVIIHIR